MRLTPDQLWDLTAVELERAEMYAKNETAALGVKGALGL